MFKEKIEDMKIAMAENEWTFVNKLLDENPDIIYESSYEGESLITLIAEYSSFCSDAFYIFKQIFNKYLLEEVDTEGNNLLEIAIRNKNYELMEFLIPYFNQTPEHPYFDMIDDDPFAFMILIKYYHIDEDGIRTLYEKNSEKFKEFLNNKYQQNIIFLK